MDHNLCIVSWNINSLQKRLTDLHAYVHSNSVDIISLQEVGINGISLQLRGYNSFELPADATNNCRGLTTYVKSSIPASFHSAFKVNGTEYLCVSIKLKDSVLFIINVYVHADNLTVDDLPDIIFHEECLIVGDLNARHKDLGTSGTQNHNGIVLNNLLNSLENSRVLGTGEATHIRGGRLDYAIIFNMFDVESELDVVNTLVSDHFAIKVRLHVEKLCFINNRKRYSIKEHQRMNFIEKVGEWYREYKKLEIKDENVFYEKLLEVIDSILNKSANKAGCTTKAKPRYYNDKIVKGWNKLLRKCHSKWSKDPSNVKNRETMTEVAEYTTEINRNARNMYWKDFLSDIGRSKTLSQIWDGVNKVRGRKKKVNVHHNPKDKARDLINKWSYASNHESLPNNIQSCLRILRSRRRKLVMSQSAESDGTCTPFTKYEILNAVKKGKSTAPGKDGLTYDVINCLISMEDSPILDLFNLSYKNGRLPVKWKIALLIPVPKGDNDYRPISLTSCLSKMMERMVLNRLLYKIDGLLSDNLYGFLKGKSTTDCVIKCLSNSNVNCRLFVDLKGAFDKANKEVILESLVNKGVKGRLLMWISDYLSNRKASVWFQGHESEEKNLELGTPQGGVLSPMLFNILMDKIASYRFYGDAQVIIYADDILIQCSDEEVMSKVIEQLQSLCIYLGLVINENKTKYQSRTPNAKEFWLNGIKLQKVSTYKYLGMLVSFHNNAKNQITCVKNICTARLKPLKVLANKGNGVGVPVLRTVYLSVVRSIIDYSAPVLVSYSEKDLRPLEVIQNEAMRVVLGCPRTTRIEIMRMELNLPSIVHRIRELSAISTLRLIRRGDGYLKSAIDKLQNGNASNFKMNSYTKKICQTLYEYNLVEFCVPSPKQVYMKPWTMENVYVKIDKLNI